MTRILVVRHGQSTWNADGRWQGWADPPLSTLGEEQAAAAARHLPPVAAVASSDLVRARRTAELLAGGAGVPLGEAFPGLRERSAGDWTGLTREQVAEGWPEAFTGEGPLRPPGGETPEAVTARVVATLHRMAEAHGDADVVAVSHGGVVRLLERHVGLVPQPVPNLAGRWFAVGAGGLEPGERVLLLEPDEDHVRVTTPQQL